MTWDFAEANPFSSSGGNFNKNISYVAKALGRLGLGKQGQSIQLNARAQSLSGVESCIN